MKLDPTALRRADRKKIRAFTKYASYITFPSNLGSCGANASLTAFVIPSGIELGIGFSSIFLQNDITVSIFGGSTITVPGSASGFVSSIGYIDSDKSIVINRSSTCPSGTVGLYAYNNWRKPHLIASGIFI